jgi:hypothetical protein
MAANTAYNAQPLQESFVDDIKYWNEDRAARREEARVDGAIEERRKNKQQEDKNDLFSRIEKQQVWDSGSTSLNQVIARGIATASEQYAPLLAIIDNPNASLSERTDAEVKLSNLNNFADNMKLFTERHTQEWEAAQKLLKDDSVYDDPKQNKVWQDGFETYQIGLDENMNPAIAFVDKNKDGVNDNIGIQSFDDIMNGVPLFQYQKKHDKTALAKAIATDVGTEETKTNSGLTSTEKLNFRQGAVEQRVDALLYGSDGKLSSPARSMLRDANLEYENPSETDIASIKTEFTKLVNSFDKTKNLEEVKRFAPTTEGNNPTSFGERVKASKQTWGEFFEQINVGSGSVPVSNVKMSAITGEKGETASNAEINNYTYHKDGSILLSLSVPKTTRHTTKEYEKLILNADETFKEQLVRMAEKGNDGYVTITYPGQNTKQVIKGSSDDEGNLANAKGISIEELRKRAGYNGKKDNSPVVGPKTESNGVGSKYNK